MFNKFFSKHNLLSLAFLVIIIVLLFSNRENLISFWSSVRSMNLFILLLIIPIRYLNYRALANYYHEFLKLLNIKLKFNLLFERIMVFNFLNIVVPFGGASGLIYLQRRYANKISPTEISISHLFYGIGNMISLWLILTIGLLIQFFSGQENNQVAGKMIQIFGLVIALIIGLIIILIFNRETVSKIVLKLVPLMNMILSLVKKNAITQKDAMKQLDHFFDRIHKVLSFRENLILPWTGILAGNLFEILTIFSVMFALNIDIAFSSVMIVYVLSMAVSITAFITGGIGAYEAVMVTSLAAFGLSSSEALTATLVYRIISLWLFLPIGFWFFRKDQHTKSVIK